MDKEKIIKKIKPILISIYLLILFILVGIQSWAQIFELGFSVSSIIYWFIFVGWIFVLILFNKNSKLTLQLSLGMFIVGVVMFIFGFKVAAETLMRVSMIGWLIGVVQAVIEYKKDEKVLH